MARSCDRTVDVVCVLWGHAWGFDLECRRASMGVVCSRPEWQHLVQDAELDSLAVWRLRNYVPDLSVPHIRHGLLVKKSETRTNLSFWKNILTTITSLNSPIESHTAPLTRDDCQCYWLFRQLDSKSLLLASHIYGILHGENHLVFNCKLHPFWVVFTVLEEVLYMLPEETSNH